MKTIWPFAANVLFFACGAIVFPFLILYYQGLGFTGPQIGLLVGLSPLVTLVAAPLWTNLADATGRHRLVASLLVVVASACLAGLPWLTHFGPVLLVVIVLSTCFMPIPSFIDSATLAMLPGQPELYGRVRLGGTFGYGLAGYFAGLLIGRYGLQWGLWVGAAVLLATLVTVQRLHFGSAPRAALPRAAGLRAAAPGGSALTLLGDRRWLPFLAVAFAGGLSTLISTNYLFAYMRELQSSEATMGLALSVGTLSEVPVLFFGNRLVTRFKSYPLFMGAMLISGGRLLLLALTRSPDGVLAVQLLAGLAFPLMWLAGVAYAHEHAPAGLAATAQGLFGAMVYGIGSAVGGLTAGPLFEWLGGRITYLVFGLVVLSIVLLVAGVQRLAAEKVTAEV